MEKLREKFPFQRNESNNLFNNNNNIEPNPINTNSTNNINNINNMNNMNNINNISNSMTSINSFNSNNSINTSNNSINNESENNNNNNNYNDKKCNKIIINFFNSIIYTKNCHKISLILILLFLFWMIYLFSFINYQNCSIMKLESEDSYFWIIIWMMNGIIFIITWNFYVYIFTSIFKYEYSKGNGNVRSSFAEEFYKSPFGFVLFFYYFDNKFLNNPIDNSLWILLGFQYFLLHYNLVQFYKQFDKEISIKSYNFTEKGKNNILLKMKLVSLSFIILAILLTFVNYVIVNIMSTLHIFFFMSKGFFAILKIIELWKTRYDEVIFMNEDIEKKERDYISNLKVKTYLELIVMLYVYSQLVALLIYGEGKPFYFTIVIIYFIIVLGYQGIIYYKQYENVNEYFWTLENSLKTIFINNEDEECIICTERIVKARQLSCGHFFHLICLSKWLEKGHNTCPVCRSAIKYKNSSSDKNRRDRNNNNNQNNRNNINLNNNNNIIQNNRNNSNNSLNNNINLNNINNHNFNNNIENRNN